MSGTTTAWISDELGKNEEMSFLKAYKGNSIRAVQYEDGTANTYFNGSLIDSIKHNYRPLGLKRHAMRIAYIHMGLRPVKRSSRKLRKLEIPEPQSKSSKPERPKDDKILTVRVSGSEAQINRLMQDLPKAFENFGGWWAWRLS